MMISTLMGQVLLLTTMIIVGLGLSRFFRGDVALACLISGVLGGWFIAIQDIDTGIRFDNIHQIVFYLILPVLIFEAAWHIKPSNLKKWFSTILMLSTLGLLVNCLVIAFVLYFLMNNPSGFPWVAALLTGAILAATDPASVVASLKTEQVPEELTTLVESESLFNDAAAIILFSAILHFSLSAKVNFSMTDFVYIFFGGLMIGAVLGLIAAIFILFLKSPSQGNIVLVSLAFASFYIGEHFFHVSGVLTTVASALVSRLLLREQEKDILVHVIPTFGWMSLYLNGLVFVIMGLTLTLGMFKEMWISMLIAIPAALIGRAIAVMGICTMMSKFARPVPFIWQMVLFWGGLRGVIAIVLVLGLPISLSYWYVIQSMVFGVVIFSVIIQSLTVPRVIRRFVH